MASIRKRGNSWQVQIRKDGYPSSTKSFKTKAHALAWARKTESEIERGIVSRGYKANPKITLGELIERYRDTVTTRKKSRVQETNRLNKLLNTSLAPQKASQITSEDIAQFRDLRLGQVGSQAVRHDLNAISQVFCTAIREWNFHFPGNPVEGLWKPPISKPRERRLTEAEFCRLEKYLSQPSESELSDLIQIALLTAMRKSEILRISSTHINSHKSVLNIAETKNGWSRRIPLCDHAVHILLNRSTENRDRLFPYDEPWCRYNWRKMLTKTDIENFHFHDLRHEAISRFFEKGLSVPEVALISGHRDYRMLARYTHLRAEDVAKKL